MQSENEDTEAKKRRFDTSDKHDETQLFFCGLSMYIFPTGIGSSRSKIFKIQTKQFGGSVDEQVQDSTTHVIVDESVTVQKLCNVQNWDKPPEHVKIVRSKWFSRCLAERSLFPSEDFELKPVISSKISIESKNLNVEKSPTKLISRSTKISADDQDLKIPNVLVCETEKINHDKFICTQSSQQTSINFNKHITDKLEKLSEVYKSTSDQWRSVSYEKAIMALKKHPKAVESWEEAKSIKGIGDGLADKIHEILQSGHLRKIDETCSEKRIAALTLFQKVWGIGPSTAESYVQQGLFTLEDLKTKAKLTKTQQIGLKYFNEIQDRMPREEASNIFDIVEEKIKSFGSEFVAVACGSYRRNRATCGDIDVLVTHPDNKLINTILPRIVENLHSIGLLTDDLVCQEENGAHKKYMGICKLPGETTKHRRIDIIAVPHEEYACALVHFTGSAYFNRSIRLLASNKNMSLSEHGLKAGVIRKGREKISEGYILPTPTEESIFTHLGLEYRPPEQRDHFAIE